MICKYILFGEFSCLPHCYYHYSCFKSIFFVKWEKLLYSCSLYIYNKQLFKLKK